MEKTNPCTFSLTEDAMFINDKKLVTLEFIFYKNDKSMKYSYLHEPGSSSTSLFVKNGRDKYCYQEEPTILVDSAINYLDEYNASDVTNKRYDNNDESPLVDDEQECK